MRIFLLLIFLLTLHLPSYAVIRYVKAGGSGTQTGQNWTNASGDLQLMINESSSTELDVIYVAEGAYLPNRPANNLNTVDPANRNNAFTFTKNIQVFGGFPATGSPGFSDRKPATFKTILSGDIGVTGTNADNCYHVVVTAGGSVTSEFLIDGFTISHGFANISTAITVNGVVVGERAGIGFHNAGGSPTLRNVSISDNKSAAAGTSFGLGFFNRDGSPALWNVVISNNEGATSQGGAFYNDNGYPVLNNVIMQGNSAISCGAYYNDRGNTIFNNVTIAGNWDNGNGAACYIAQGSITFNNSVVFNNAGKGVEVQHHPGQAPGTVSYNSSLVQGVAGGSNGNLDGTTFNPDFVDPAASSSSPTAAGNYRLKATSPCVNAGNNALLPEGLSTDLDGRDRISAVTVDMGAYEYDATLPVTITSFSAKVSGCNARLSWKAEEESQMSHYEIEAAGSPRGFGVTGKVLSLNEPGRIYYFDLNQHEGTAYYRLKAVETDGSFDYSRILAVTVKCAETASITLFPNPSAEELTVSGGKEGQFIEIVNAWGKSLLKQAVSGSQTRISVRDYPGGLYYATITAQPGGAVKTIKFVVQ